MMNWTTRDWASVFIGWICALAVFAFLPWEQPWKFVAVFAAGFVSAWIARMLIP